jgi:folate-binding protein YgfZ
MSDVPRCLPLAKRSLLVFRGPDAVRYLNGQLTQDVRRLGDTALPSCVTDAKGRLQFYVHVFQGPEDSIWVEGPEEVAEELEARLTRYLIADDVEVENFSGAWSLHHVVDCREAPAAGPGFVRAVNRIGSGGFDVWLPAGAEFSCTALSREEAEARRIAAGIPAWGTELTAGMLPPEAGLDRSAISYHKGCYIGQEVLSRIKSAGKVNRRLAAFRVEAGTVAGDDLVTDSGAKAGILTSVSRLTDDSGKHVALGYVEKAGFGAEELAIPGNNTRARLTRLL